MGKNIIVKEYKNKYQSQVVDLILSIQQQEYNISISVERQPDLFAIEYFYQTDIGNFWVALLDEKVIGTIGLFDIGDHQVALRRMFVKKEYRGPAYQTAKRLLDHAINWANEKSIETIHLGTTVNFKAAQRFYEKNGFKRIDAECLPSSFPKVAIDDIFYRYVVNINNLHSMEEVRANIDRIDNQIVRLISERSEYVAEAARFKNDVDAVKAPERVEEVIQKVKYAAEQNHVNPALIEKVYRTMITCFIEEEMEEQLRLISKENHG